MCYMSMMVVLYVITRLYSADILLCTSHNRVLCIGHEAAFYKTVRVSAPACFDILVKWCIIWFS